MRTAYVGLSAIGLIGCASLISCASQPAKDNSDEPKVFVENSKVKIVGFMENEQGRKIRLALGREEVVRSGEDSVVVEMVLQLPQIEVPRDLERGAKLNMKREPDNGVHVWNNHVCVTGTATSAKRIDYSKAGWKFNLQIDGKKVLSEADLKPSVLFDFDANKVIPIPDKTNLNVCSKGKFPEVKNALLTLLNAKNETLLMFLWSAPWP